MKKEVAFEVFFFIAAVFSLSLFLKFLSHLKLPEVVLGLPFEEIDFLQKLLLVVLELAHGVFVLPDV